MALPKNAASKLAPGPAKGKLKGKAGAEKTGSTTGPGGPSVPAGPPKVQLTAGASKKLRGMG